MATLGISFLVNMVCTQNLPAELTSTHQSQTGSLKLLMSCVYPRKVVQQKYIEMKNHCNHLFTQTHAVDVFLGITLAQQKNYGVSSKEWTY